MHRSLETFAMIQLGIVGLSHVFQPHAWVDFFIGLRARGHAGVLIHGFLSLGFGSMILAFHPVWTGVPAVLTVVGCLYTFKAMMCFLVPSTQMRTLARVAHERAHELVVPGLGYVAVALLLAYELA